ncbi:MAG TPA: hypothetical protein VFH37_01860 [Candidatus Saccharimonadales bacterium]|nr:hypothetical protein [Candidatus Saccharimonadales bacterium]
MLEIKPAIPEFLKKVDFENRVANFDDINILLNNGWLAGIDLNPAALNDSANDNYMSHMAVIFGGDEHNHWLYDPGLTLHPHRKISQPKLAKAWFWAAGKRLAWGLLK